MTNRAATKDGHELNSLCRRKNGPRRDQVRLTNDDTVIHHQRDGFHLSLQN
jgi:hypothetical protein